MEKRSKLVEIKVENIYPHPDNPRKDLGDISELTESVKKSGIMQNLTVIPISALNAEPDKQPEVEELSLSRDFHVLIGHRRLAAAKAAGLTEVPCKIVSKISKKEQVSIMLEENMQRSDLTIYEQAQGFQMMLDLGETAETIAQKTGFSQATVYHRLNLAKLDPKELKDKESNDGFQMSLKDLYELEKINDIETRNRILREANNSNDLAFKARTAAREEKRQEFMKELAVMLEEKGIKPAPKKVEGEQWSGKWDKLKQYDLEGELPDEIKVQARKRDELFYVRWYNQIYIIRKLEKKKKTKSELEWEEKERRKKAIKSLTKQLVKRTKEYIKCIVTGTIKSIKETEELKREIWDVILCHGPNFYKSTIFFFLAGKNSWDCTDEEKKDIETKIEKLNSMQILLVAMACSINETLELYNYYEKYDKEKAEGLIKVYRVLEKYGWCFEGDEEQLLDGTHELYVKEEK